MSCDGNRRRFFERVAARPDVQRALGCNGPSAYQDAQRVLGTIYDTARNAAPLKANRTAQVMSGVAGGMGALGEAYRALGITLYPHTSSQPAFATQYAWSVLGQTFTAIDQGHLLPELAQRAVAYCQRVREQDALRRTNQFAELARRAEAAAAEQRVRQVAPPLPPLPPPPLLATCDDATFGAYVRAVEARLEEERGRMRATPPLLDEHDPTTLAAYREAACAYLRRVGGAEPSADVDVWGAVQMAVGERGEREAARLKAQAQAADPPVYHDFSGANCEGGCRGWDGWSARCDCGNRRVSWTVEPRSFVEENPIFYGEAH